MNTTSQDEVPYHGIHTLPIFKRPCGLTIAKLELTRVLPNS